MSSQPLQGIRVAVLGDLLATSVASTVLRDLGACIEKCDTIFENADVVLGDRPSFSKLLNRGPLEPAALELSRRHPGCACFLEFTHSARLTEQDSRVPNERAAASEAGLYESLVPFAPPNVFDQPVCSFSAGIYGAFSVASALVARERSISKSSAIAVPLVGAGYSLLSLQGLFAFEYPLNWKPVRWMAAPFKDLWRARDGSFVYVHVGLSQHLRRFFEVLQEYGHESDALEIRRHVHQTTLLDPVEPQGYFSTAAIFLGMRKLFLKRDGSYWEKMLSDAGLCCIRVRSYEEWFGSDLARDCGFVMTGENGERSIAQTIRAYVRESVAASPALFEKPLSPFQGLRVLDFSQVIAGPLAGRTLAELGADVLRVENPHMRQSFVEPFAAAYHAGKRVLPVDLRKPEGKAELERVLFEWQPDVVLHNFARGVPEKLGIAEEQLRARISNLIYLDINAFGDTGPLSALPGFEQTAQALVGVAHESAKRGVPKLFLLPIHDMGAGLMGATGVAAAQFHRLRSGNGARIHTSLASASMLLQSVHPKRMSTGELLESATRGKKFGNLFRTLDAAGHWMLVRSRLTSGHDVPLVRAPVDSSSWENRFTNPKNLPTVPQRGSLLERASATFAEIGWGMWWIVRSLL